MVSDNDLLSFGYGSMQAGRPSQTAFGAALHRAAHQLRTQPLVFDDPFALLIVGKDAEAALRQDGHSRHARLGLQALIAARSRLAEDAMIEALGRGVRRYVVLGAGLDTFAYRAITRFPDVTVYEVDHPATQAWKRQQVNDARLPAAPNLVYVPVDFEREALTDRLADVGFSFAQPAVFAWLGVVPYLTMPAIEAALSLIAAMPSATEVIFDYAEPAKDGADSALAARVAQIGEPLHSFFTPQVLAQKLKDMGISHIEDWDAAALNARYFEGRKDGLRLSGRAHVMRARIQG